MSDFRKLFLALAVVGLLVGSAVTASAQPPITCNVTGNPLTVRAEGLAELVGDVVMNCTQGTAIPAGGSVQTVNISLTLSTNITSRLVNDPRTEALLFIDDPDRSAQNPCAGSGAICAVNGLMTSDGMGGSLGSGGQYARAINVFQGTRQNPNTIVWLGVPINPPGTVGNRVFRIKNVRAAISGASAPNGQIFGFLSIQNPPANLQLNNASAVVGFVQTGLAFARRNPCDTDSFSEGAVLEQCVRFNSDMAGDPGQDYSSPGGRLALLRYREAYNTSFKARDVNSPNPTGLDDQSDPRVNYTRESGFFNTLFPTTNGLNAAGRADHGTRLLARFGAVPANVRIYVSAAPVRVGQTGTGAFGVLTDGNGRNTALGTIFVSPTNRSATSAVCPPPADTGEGTFPTGAVSPPGTSAGLIEVPIDPVARTGWFTWEVVAANDIAQDTFWFSVTYAFTAGSAGLGQATVNASFAPLSTSNVMADSGTPVPRFADTTTASNLTKIVSCVTNLLFPFVSNSAGFDTGIAISNTTADPFGTAAQSGNCKLNYYGETTGGGAAPAPQTTKTVIPSGKYAAFTLSTGGTNGIAATPGFSGYIIAQCDFRYAHGFAFISDLGAARLSHGYLALIIDGGGATRGTGVASEALGM